MQSELISKVWRISGVFGKAEAGALVWRNGKIAFITEAGIIFEASLSCISNIKWPLLRMGMGFDAEVYGKKYKFSFAKPNASAPEIKIVHAKPLPKVIYLGLYIDDVSSLADIKNDRVITKKWKELLTNQG